MKKTLTVVDAVSLIIGIVIGVGIFKAPSLVALHTGNVIIFFAVWLAGGLFFASPLPSGAPPSTPFRPLPGLTMVFVLLTYGGWNEAAYISAELKDLRKNMARSLIWSISIITLLYILINATYWKILGMHGMAGSNAVAYDAMARITGSGGATLVSLLVAVSALSSMNGVIITGSRTNYALWKEFTLFCSLGSWKKDAATPVRALVVQGVISLLLVLLGTVTMRGFVTMVEFTAPVFWFFFFLTTLSLIVLRSRDPEAARPFRASLYPATPILFCCVCLFMFISSIQYTGIGALAGAALLCAGLPFLMISKYHNVQEGRRDD